LIEKAGNQMAKQSKRMGIQFNFAPVVDINTNPKNPIIGNRSFGETKENVTLRALALMKGLQVDWQFGSCSSHVRQIFGSLIKWSVSIC